MGHKSYMKAGFSQPSKQRNVIAFVGNGFDIQVMHDYHREIDTRYESFYHFLKLHSFNTENPIYQQMGKLRQAGKENWSDIEGVVGELLAANPAAAYALSKALLELQDKFSEFLDLAVPSSLLVNLGNDSMNGRLALASLVGFLGDLSPEEYLRLRFPGRCENFDIYNFLFFNFNYTPLLDNFIYLDQRQFDPKPYRTVDRNFSFEGNPSMIDGASVREGDTFSSYVMSEIVHPHGSQGVPRSLLFGLDLPESVNGNQDQALRLAKPFWAQNEARYNHLFADTELFMIFGCSLGKSDRWWWKSVADVLGMPSNYAGGAGSFEAEVIIYWYNSPGKELTALEVRMQFLDAAGRGDRYDDLKDYIRVVLYSSSSDRTWLNTSQDSLTTQH